MIQSYRDKRTRDFAAGGRIPAFQSIERQAQRRLTLLDSAASTRGLQGIPGNQFEALRGDRAGQFSIRINGQWRICFRWPEGEDGPFDVEIVDYH